MGAVAGHFIDTLIRALLLFVGASAIVIGAMQLVRTMRLGALVKDADSVIVRGGIMVGAGVAFIYAATRI